MAVAFGILAVYLFGLQHHGVRGVLIFDTLPGPIIGVAYSLLLLFRVSRHFEQRAETLKLPIHMTILCSQLQEGGGGDDPDVPHAACGGGR